MDLCGKVDGDGWTVTAHSKEKGVEFGCHIGMTAVTLRGALTREFAHDRTFRTAEEAVLEGLKEGMSWVDLTRSNTVVSC